MGIEEVDGQGAKRALTQKNNRVEEGDNVEAEEGMC